MNVAYHRLPRTWPKYRWWKPLVTGLIALSFFVALTLVVVVALVVAVFLDPDGIGAELKPLVFEGVIDTSVPIVLIFSLVSVALMLPSILLARLLMGPRPIGLISSVAGRLRWGWMLRLVVPALVTFAGFFAVSLFVLPPLFGEQILPPEIGDRTWVTLLIVVLLVPFQATAEEYVFRGYLMQTIGGWLKHPAFAILLPVPLFMIGHTQYDIWGALDVGVFALFAGWLTWRTGGLEAAIVAHIVNNAAIFALGAFALVDPNASEGSPLGIAVTALTLAVYSWLVVWMSRRQNLQTTRLAAIALTEDTSDPAEAALVVESPPSSTTGVVDSHS